VEDGVVGVMARDLMAAVKAGGAVKKRVQEVEAILEIITQERREECTLKSVNVNAEASKGLCGLMDHAKNQQVLGTDAAAASLALIRAGDAEGGGSQEGCPSESSW
jgi:hypothetical protein